MRESGSGKLQPHIQNGQKKGRKVYDKEANKDLFREMILSAITDLDKVSTTAKKQEIETDRQSAFKWFESNSNRPGSFVWCCQILSADEEALRKVIFNEEMRKKLKFKLETANRERTKRGDDENSESERDF